jgi:hypothetical protein
MDAYNKLEKGGKSESDSFREGSTKPEKAKAPKFEDTYNPDKNVPKLPQLKGHID